MTTISMKSIWSVFKNLDIEKQYVFYVKDNEWVAHKISTHETKSSGSLDVEYFIEISDEFKGQKVWIVHNHPNATPTPSDPDFSQKEYFESLQRLLGFELADYMIASEYGYVSFSENGLISPYTQEEVTDFSYQEVNLPSISSHRDIELHKNKIIKLLDKFGEILITPNGAFASEFFNGKDLLSLSIPFSEKHVFISKKKDGFNQMERVFHFNNITSPLEIYSFDDKKLTPLKKCGFF